MKIELINTGSELTLGRVLNTHLQWIGRRLAELGHPLTRQSCVPDTAEDIGKAVAEAISRADLIITTGGLGPTSDDLTRDEIARLFGLPLEKNAEVLRQIETYFSGRKRPMPASTQIQAMVPRGALVLHNAHGTAPGLALRVPENLAGPSHVKKWLVMLPGPPRELHPMFNSQVVPLIEREFPRAERFATLTLRTVGLGESIVEERIAPALAARISQGLEVGYCARMGEVEVRLSARGPAAPTSVAEAEQTVRQILGRHIYGVGDDTLESVYIRLLSERRATVALAESCTGGFIAHRLTNVSGASEVFLSGLVTYSNVSKINLLGVRAETIAAHGAVSEETALEMAAGVRRVTGSDYGLAVTGIAGPTGGTTEKPTGTVFIAVSSPVEARVWRFLNTFDRETFKLLTSYQALNLLRVALLDASEAGPSASHGPNDAVATQPKESPPLAPRY